MLKIFVFIKKSLKTMFLLTLVIYKKFISPFLPDSCRFYPTCSEYMYKAIEKHGILKGIYLGTKRLIRCNPFCQGGLDYVPEKFTFFRDKNVK